MAPNRAQMPCCACIKHARNIRRCPARRYGRTSTGPQGPVETMCRHDNLRAGNGETSPVWAPCPWMAGLLARRSWSLKDRRVLLAFPGLASNTKERTIRRIRGVLPRLIVLPPQWLFRPAVLQRPAAPCDLSPLETAERMENPRCNTVAGSAAFRVPGWGPRLRIPFCSPDNISAVRKPSSTRIRPRSKPSQSQLRRRAASLRTRVDQGLAEQSGVTAGSQSGRRRMVPTAPCSTGVPLPKSAARRAGCAGAAGCGGCTSATGGAAISRGGGGTAVFWVVRAEGLRGAACGAAEAARGDAARAFGTIIGGGSEASRVEMVRCGRGLRTRGVVREKAKRIRAATSSASA